MIEKKPRNDVRSMSQLEESKTHFSRPLSQAFNRKHSGGWVGDSKLPLGQVKVQGYSTNQLEGHSSDDLVNRLKEFDPNRVKAKVSE